MLCMQSAFQDSFLGFCALSGAGIPYNSSTTIRSEGYFNFHLVASLGVGCIKIRRVKQARGRWLPEEAVPAKTACIYSFGSFPADPINVPATKPSARPHIKTDATVIMKACCDPPFVVLLGLFQSIIGATIKEVMNMKRPVFILCLKLSLLLQSPQLVISANTSIEELI